MSYIKVFASRNMKPSLVSRLVMKKKNTKYSHVGIVINGVVIEMSPQIKPNMTVAEANKVFGKARKVDLPTVYHAVGEGVVKELQEKFFAKRQYVEVFDVTHLLQLPIEVCWGYLEGRLGVEYSSSAYLGFAVPWFQKLFGSGGSKVVCSELVYAFLVWAGVLPEGYYNDADYVDPEMIVRALKGVC